jgi:hypothetical protein
LHPWAAFIREVPATVPLRDPAIVDPQTSIGASIPDSLREVITIPVTGFYRRKITVCFSACDIKKRFDVQNFVFGESRFNAFFDRVSPLQRGTDRFHHLLFPCAHKAQSLVVRGHTVTLAGLWPRFALDEK